MTENNSEIVNIDGSLLEGGGQILRIALTLSCLKRIPVRIFNIRAGRNKPGLLDQHFKGVLLIEKLSNGKVVGANIGSTEITFYPGKEIYGGNFEALIKTAGSISLLLQVSLPCALFAKSKVTLRLTGGTNVEMAPQIDYMMEVFRPVLQKFGGDFELKIIRRGYYPKGGGEVVVNIEPVTSLKGIQLTNPGKITKITGSSFVSGKMSAFKANNITESALKSLKNITSNINVRSYKEPSHLSEQSASGILLIAHTDTDCILGSDALGKYSEDVKVTGTRAAKNLIENIEAKACVDDRCQDQIIVFMCLAVGASSVRVGNITMHTKTAIFIAEMLTKVKFNIETLSDGGNVIHCTGN